MTATKEISAMASNGPATIDCETAALIRAVILPLFEAARSWPELIDAMQKRGYGLAFREGTFCITEADTGARLCGLRFLGLTMEQLIERMGRPCVKAAPGGTADGCLMRNPPVRAAIH
ncbi:hypothetical protein [Ruegeria marina]|uniref:Uncharacterized protein n=1 Tax=Ruegeria marina TaxID=639004 RepID=A0A1G6KX40_9RHOB|nr:hypothetical protein [Ruegeria marina]SDC35669.1 hypothetical protein SAMN04488239_10280 [Ruegeria marina]